MAAKQLVRVRFAPSPTGYLHLGGLRTAFYNYLFARQHQGQLILRIEDTDRDRFVEDAEDDITSVMNTYGLQFDEGPGIGGPFGPYRQSERTHLYKQYANSLLSTGAAYRCFCSKDRIDAMRRKSIVKGKPFMYDRKCLHLTDEQVQQKLSTEAPHTIRMKVPEGQTEFKDLVFGRKVFENATVDDQILIKSDGMPTYHLANVVDDHLMKITHVIRGLEWMTSTPKHLMLYSALNLTPPEYAHLPLLINQDTKGKLSKRDRSFRAEKYLQEGFLREAMLNYLGSLGWTGSRAKEGYLMSLDEMVTKFSLDQIRTMPIVASNRNMQDLNRSYLLRKFQDPEGRREICEELRQLVKLKETAHCMKPFSSHSDEYFSKILLGVQKEIHRVRDVVDKFPYFFFRPKFNNQVAQEMRREITVAVNRYCGVVDDSLRQGYEGRELVKLFGMGLVNKRKTRMKMLRYTLIAFPEGPQIQEVVDLLGPDEVRERLRFFSRYKNDANFFKMERLKDDGESVKRLHKDEIMRQQKKIGMENRRAMRKAFVASVGGSDSDETVDDGDFEDREGVKSDWEVEQEYEEARAKMSLKRRRKEEKELKAKSNEQNNSDQCVSGGEKEQMDGQSLKEIAAQMSKFE